MSVAVAAVLDWRQYICRVCGLVYDEAVGDADSGLAPGTRFEDIPDDWACPICGVGKADFVLFVPVAAAPAAGAPRARARRRADPGVVIVGAGHAGWQVAQALRERGFSGTLRLVTACSGDVYDKPQLSVAFARKLTIEGLARESGAAAARRLDVDLMPQTHAIRIDSARRTLRTTRGTLRWRHLVLAHGGEPALPPVFPPALTWRVNDLAAYTRFRAALAQRGGTAQRIAIVGAGLVGCELANDLALAGHGITLIDTQAHPLATQLPAVAGQRLLAAWHGLPIRFIGGAQVTSVEALHGKAQAAQRRLHLHDGRSLVVDHLVAATGLRIGGGLAASASLVFDSQAGGIAVDGCSGATSHPGIHALGDCAVVDGVASRTIEPIARQARGVAAAIAGDPASAGGSAAGPFLLQVKTSALPIRLCMASRERGRWQVDLDDGQGLHMSCIGADGATLATLEARAARRRMPLRAQG